MKKIFSIFMAMLFAVTCSFTSVNADSRPLTSNVTGSITVQGLENGAEVKLYKIIDVNVDSTTNQPKAPVYTWNSNFTGKLGDIYEGTNGEVLEKFSELQGSAAKDVLEGLAKGLSGIEANHRATATADTLTFTEVAMGEYLVVVTAPQNGNKTYAISTAQLLPSSTKDGWVLNDETITVKSSPKGISKEVVGGDLSVSIGDTVNYKVTATIPAFPEDTYKKIKDEEVALVKIGDKLGVGLTLNTSSITVKNGSTTLTPGTHYTLNTTSTDKFTFEVSLGTDYVLNNQNAEITVEYAATVNASAITTNALGNKAYEATRDPYSENYNTDIPSPEVNVHTYGIDLTKVAKDGITPLKGAEFSLKPTNGTAIPFVLENGVYRKALSTETDTATTTLVVGENGKLTVKGIDVGTYILTETKAATGMVLPNNPDITITLVDGTATVVADGTLDSGDAGTKATGEQNLIFTQSISTNVLSLSVVNSTDAAFELPNTGGVGTMIFTVAGMLLMAGAVVYLTVSHKKA